MNFSVQVIVHPEDDTEASPVVRKVFTLDRDNLAPDTLDLQLAEAKDLLAAMQDTVAGQQATAAIAKQVAWRRTPWRSRRSLPQFVPLSTKTGAWVNGGGGGGAGPTGP